MIISKLKAAGFHFSLSLIVITLAIGLIIYFWFPGSLVKVGNFKEIAVILVAVDLVLGPLLTFVVYKPKKKSLKFDLGTIALVQTVALVYGLHTIYLAHPVFITFNVDRFTTISAKDAEPHRAKLDSFNISKLSSPKLAIAKFPADEKEKSNLLLEVLSGKPDIESRPEYYYPIDENMDEIIAKSLDPTLIFNKLGSKQKHDKFIKKHGNSIENYAYLPLQGAARDAVIVIDKNSAQFIDVISVDPWVLSKK